MNCDFSSIRFKFEADKLDHMSKCHNLIQQVEMTCKDFDDEGCFRVLCSAARESEFGLVQRLLSSNTQKIAGLGVFGKLLLAVGEG